MSSTKKTGYLIVGGGMTADAACRGIRELDPDGGIVLATEEHHPPYARPPLSKELWDGTRESTIWRGTAELGVELLLGRRIVSLDLEQRVATDDRGASYTYERLLLATGGTPRRLPFERRDVIYFRTLDDYRNLRDIAGPGVRVAVVGGGFIGSELAAALRSTGCSVTLVFPAAGIGARLFPAELSASLTDYYRSRGVEVLAGETVTGIERDHADIWVSTSGHTFEADALVAGIGIEPNVELAIAAGLPVSNGIVVDGFGRVGGRDDVFAAGDVARFRVAALAAELRVEHEDHALSHGRCVGANMAGAGEVYDHLPRFDSDLFAVGYEAVGRLDSRLEMLVEWGELDGEGTVTYLDRERRPCGVLLWNRPGQLDEAVELVRGGEPVSGRRPHGLNVLATSWR
jgi:3-phenylpropionate/trans-cinnamate dioxygenase ferredoxin reductase subunit